MSVRVDPRDLAEAVAGYGFAYLVTVGEGGAHVLAVLPELTADGIVIGGVGRHSLGNVAATPRATLVWPPVEPTGYSLLVDGDAVADDAAAVVTVTPTKAVLHRPATSIAADGTATRTGSDCAPLA